MARRIRRGVEAFGHTSRLFQDPGGAIRQGSGAMPWESYPRYDLETERSDEPKEEMLEASRKIALRTLQEEQVLPLADLAHRIAEELMINPNYTYRELFEEIRKDKRFVTTATRLVGLASVGDPGEAYYQKMAKKRMRRREGL